MLDEDKIETWEHYIDSIKTGHDLQIQIKKFEEKNKIHPELITAREKLYYISQRQLLTNITEALHDFQIRRKFSNLPELKGSQKPYVEKLEQAHKHWIFPKHKKPK